VVVVVVVVVDTNKEVICRYYSFRTHGSSYMPSNERRRTLL